MGRSVETISGSVATVYLNISEMDGFEEGYFDWEDFTEDVSNVITEKYPSFRNRNDWLGRETRILLENNHARIAIAEYMGCVAVSLIPLDHWGESEAALAQAWTDQISENFVDHMHKRFSGMAMNRHGTMSNGVSVYSMVGA